MRSATRWALASSAVLALAGCGMSAGPLGVAGSGSTMVSLHRLPGTPVVVGVFLENPGSHQVTLDRAELVDTSSGLRLLRILFLRDGHIGADDAGKLRPDAG
jgi:hypothetical protein